VKSREDSKSSTERIHERLKRDISDAARSTGEGTQLDPGRLARVLAAETGARVELGLASAALEALHPEMARRAAADLRRRVLGCVLLALLPLPFVVVYAGYVLQALYVPISILLTPDIAGYVASVHMLLLALLFGTTYAAIPMMLARSAASRPTPGALSPA
jgi:hypothetical protein